MNPFDYDDKDKDKLSLLCITDIHMNKKKLEKLKNWYVEFCTDKYDYVIITGDFDNIPNKELVFDKEVCVSGETNIT